MTEQCALFDGLWAVGERHQVWMSHGDKVTAFAPGFKIVAVSDGAPFAVIADEERRYYGTQFHPEVVHTPDGAKLIANFVHHVCGRHRRLDDGRLSRRQDRRDPRAGRRRAR